MEPQSCIAIFTVLTVLCHAGAVVSGEIVRINATQTTYVEVNKSLVLSCSYEGNSTPTTCYFRSNNGMQISIGITGCLYAPSSNYTVTCVDINTVVFTLLRTGMEEHGVKWACAFRASSEIKSDFTEIRVNVPVSTVMLSFPSGSQVTLAENTAKDFRCKTSASRPIPTLSWFMDNNTPQPTDDIPISQRVSQSPAAGSEDFVATTGFLTYEASRLANGKYVFCQSSDVDRDIVVSDRKILLNVTFKPDRGPLITNYNNNIIYYAITNRPQVLTCTIPGGNPLATISWSCFNENEENLSSGQMVSKRLTWRASSNGTCTCTSTHLGDDENVMLHVAVLLPPTYPKFTLHSETVEGKTTVKIIRNSTEPIICTAASVPAPDKYTWKYDGKSSPLSHMASLYPSQMADNGRYFCEVGNTMSPTQGQIENGNNTTYVVIQRLFATAKPVLTFGSKDGPSLPSSFQVVEKDDFNMYCSSIGNPVPNYIWTGNERTVREQLISVQSITQDRLFTCTASNTMEPSFLQSVTTMSFSNVSVFVLFPPSDPTKRYHYSPTGSTPISSLKVIKGKSFNVTCDATAKPPPVISWTGPRTLNSGTLVFTSVEESYDGIYNCTARNVMNRTFGTHEVGTVTSSLHIDVLFAPLVKPFSIEPVVEGTVFSIECKTEPGNPAATTYSWKRKLQSENVWTSLPSSDVSGSLLTKQKISRHDAGIYNCTAWNVMKPTAEQQQNGTSSKTFILDILYKSNISRFIEINHSLSQEVTVSEHSSIHLQCEVDSNPGSTIIISKDGETKVSMNNRKQISFLNSSVTCDTAGTYKCIGYNAYNIGENKPSKDLKLFVTCSPRLSSVDDFKKNITSALNEAAILKINIMAYPVPKKSDYTWWVWNRETWDMVKTGNNIHINTSGLESSVIFHSVQQTDYQRYRLNVSNDYGHFHQEVFLNPYGKPESPRNVGFMEESVSQSTAQLSWNPGFNGGLDQTFVVLYKKNVDSTWLHVSIEDEKTESMNVTLKGLASGTTYEFQMYSRNSLGNSSFSKVYTFNTREMTTNEPFPAALIGGGIGGSVAAIVLISVIVVLFLRRSTFTKGKAKDASDGCDRKPVYEEDDEDGMQDNPMYVSAGPRNVNFNTGACSSEGAVEYSTVNKAAKAVDSVNDNEYAVVSKPKQAQTKTGKKEKKHGFFKDKKGKKAIPEGDIYENSPASEMKVVTKKEETIYENPETSAPKKNVNKDGLIYADLSFNDPPKGQRKLVIHGLDSMTEYVEVDFTKKADPLPDSDDENIPAKN